LNLIEQDCLNFILKSSKKSLNCEEYVSELNTDLDDDGMFIHQFNFIVIITLDDVLQMKDSRLTTFESVGYEIY
jgi:hypothetical protein